MFRPDLTIQRPARQALLCLGSAAVVVVLAKHPSLCMAFAGACSRGC
jgi:hypothetical protein